MDCMTLGNDIAKVSLALNGFVREVREARADVDGISRELHSLQSVLDLLKEDTELFPRPLAVQTPIVLEHCNKVLAELDYCFSILNRADLPRQDKRKLWAARGKRESSRFKPALEAHRALIGLALDLVEATTPREVAHDVEDDEAYGIEQPEYGSSTIENVSRIIGELGSLRIRLAKEFEKDPEYVLHDYMMILKSYGEAVISGSELEYTAEQGAYMGENELFGAYIGDSPDSAIGLYNNEPVLQTLRDAIARNAEYGGGVHPIIDDIIEEEEPADLAEASRAPTPPPKDVKRRELARRRSSMVVSPSFQMPMPTDSASPTDSQFAVVTEIETGKSQESNDSQESSGSNSQGASGSSSTQGSASPPTPKSSRFSKILGSVRRKTSYERPATAAASPHHHPPLPGSSCNSRPSGEMRPSTPVMQGSLVRRGSRRLSVTFKKLPMWNAEIDQLLMGATGTDGNHTDGATNGSGGGGDPVFGVPLQKSIATAKGTAKTHHSGGGRATRREYPLCVQKSCLYIKEEGGVSAPNIFADPGDPRRVQRLKEAFSRAPGYGHDVDWDAYGPHDAADIVLLFLAQLPKPLVTESAARRWVALSRQAMVSGGVGGKGGGGGGGGGRAARPWEECIDFWEEALGAIRGGPARSLFKLLLNLWADVAAAADHNDMTAERLASCVLKPLMHVSPADRHETDFVLALAFLIRRRGEYVDMLRMDQDQDQDQDQDRNRNRKDVKVKAKRISRVGW